MNLMSYAERITIDPAKREGKPSIRGLRITVSDVLEYLASGMTEDEILKEFPDLEREDIRACLEFAADRERMMAPLTHSLKGILHKSHGDEEEHRRHLEEKHR